MTNPEKDLIPPTQDELNRAALGRLKAVLQEAKAMDEKAPNKYRKLAIEVRASDLQRREVSKQLQSQGLSQTRVSEIMAIAGAPAPLFRKFSRGTIGFRTALKEARVIKMSPRERREQGVGELQGHLKRVARFAESHSIKFPGNVLIVETDAFRVCIEKTKK